jgi:hypothetical protein
MSSVDALRIAPSAVLRVTDAFTALPPAGRVRILRGKAELRAVVTPSQYLVLYGLRPGPLQCTVACEGFLPRDITLNVSGNPTPVVDVALPPSPAYRFPRDSTLVRGLVLEEGQRPVEGVSVSLETASGSHATFTDAEGEFVLFMNRYAPTGVKKMNGGLLVKALDESAGLACAFAKKGYLPATSAVSIAIGSETRMKVIMEKGGE